MTPRTSIYAAVVVAASVFVGQQSEAATYTISDTTFAPSNWADFKYADPSGLSQYQTAQLSPGGSPFGPNTPDYRATRHQLFPPLIRVVHEYTSFIWIPGAREIATSIDYSYDLIYLAGPPGAVRYSPYIRQGSNLFMLDTLFDDIFSPSWQQFGMNGLSLTDFGLIDPTTGAILAGFNPFPTFPMTFGFTSNNSAGGFVDKMSGLDNFVLTLHTIPEPNNFVVLGAVGMMLTLLRRVRRISQEVDANWTS
jgi:hypothetical protein